MVTLSLRHTTFPNFCRPARKMPSRQLIVLCPGPPGHLTDRYSTAVSAIDCHHHLRHRVAAPCFRIVSAVRLAFLDYKRNPFALPTTLVFVHFVVFPMHTNEDPSVAIFAALLLHHPWLVRVMCHSKGILLLVWFVA